MVINVLIVVMPTVMVKLILVESSDITVMNVLTRLFALITAVVILVVVQSTLPKTVLLLVMTVLNVAQEKLEQSIVLQRI